MKAQEIIENKIQKIENEIKDINENQNRKWINDDREKAMNLNRQILWHLDELLIQIKRECNN